MAGGAIPPCQIARIVVGMETPIDLVVQQWMGERPFQSFSVKGGATNTIWRIESGDTALYLRRYSRLAASSVEREHKLINHVSDSGVPIARPLPRMDGAGTVVEADGYAFSLFEQARGVQLEPGEFQQAHAVSSGRTLARLHIATSALDISGFSRWDLTWSRDEWLQRLARVREAILGRDRPTSRDEWALRRVEAQSEWLGDPRCSHEYAPHFESQVVHGDYQHANLFFVGTDVGAVIDWDTAVAMPRAYEVVRACAFMFPLDRELTRAFLGAYQELNPLHDGELADGARAWGIYHDHHVWPLEETYFYSNEAAARFIPERPFVPFAEAWLEVC